MMKKSSVFVIKNYAFSLILLGAILTGAGAGIFWGKSMAWVKPFGDIFLNLLFTAVVPLVFFSISSAAAGMSNLEKLGKITGWMLLIFVATGILSASLMIFGVKCFPPVTGSVPALPPVQNAADQSLAQIVRAFTVPDFLEILSKKNMLALILFSLLVGIAASQSRERGKAFSDFLMAGNAVMTRLIRLIMFYAPVGLGAYFAYLTGVFGTELVGPYFRAVILYYPLSAAYFFIAYSFYTWLAGGRETTARFWKHILLPSLTALGTGSSLAAIPANEQASDEMGVPQEISRVVIPIGATIHMDGTCLAAILKISILFSFFHLPFAGISTYVTAIGIALLSGMVMSGIPGGGFLGELLIVTMYGFPVEALPLISMVGTLVDPPATMVNSTGDTVVSMMVSRLIYGKNWIIRKEIAS